MSSADLDGTAHDQPLVASSARIVGRAHLGTGSVVAQGTVIRSLAGSVELGTGSAILENSVVIGSRDGGVQIGARCVFGHRAVVLDAEIGDLCEIGNGTVLLPGARLGDRVFTGEGTLIPPGTEIADESVVVGRPGRVVRRASAADLDRLRALRGGDLTVPDAGALISVGSDNLPGGTMGTLYPYRDRTPVIDPTALLFDSAEITGDVVIGARSVIGAGVKIIGDSHGPVRIGERVQILENTVLHLLPDNDLVVEDDVVIGPACMVHGCHIGAATIIEPAAILCDGSRVGAGSIVRAGSCVKQRDTFDAGLELSGFPARVVGDHDAADTPPGWALPYQAVVELVDRAR